MLMVVFGAGASYDSAPSYAPGSSDGDRVARDRPPLADQLFDNRTLFAEAIDRFRPCQPIVPLLRSRKGDAPVERVLEKLQNEAENYPEGQRQLAAIRYYLHFIIWECEARWQKIHMGVTNYTTLLDRIHRWRRPPDTVCLVTFNYDRMLERALPTVGVEIETLPDYVNSNDYKLIKLHGSVNWGREIEETPVKRTLAQLRDDQLPNEVIRLFPVLQISNRYRIAYTCPMAKPDSIPIFPAVAIPVETKRDFECPDYHLDALRKCIPEVTKLLIIGWRATDAPFLEMLQKGLSRTIHIMVVAGDKQKANEVVDKMQEAGIRASEFRRSEGGFTDFIVHYQADDFLKS